MSLESKKMERYDVPRVRIMMMIQRHPIGVASHAPWARAGTVGGNIVSAR